MNTAGHTSAGPSPPGGRTARDMGDSYLGVEHAFLAIIRDRAGLPVINAALGSLGRL